MKHCLIALLAALALMFPPHHPRCIDPPCPKGHLCIPAGERCRAHIAYGPWPKP